MPDTPVAESNDNPNSKAIEIDDELVNKLTIKISDMLCTDLKGDKTIELFMAIIKTAQGQKVAADLKKKQNDELKYTAKLVSGGENMFENILASIYPNDTPQELTGLANDQLGMLGGGPYSPYILYHYLRIIGELLEEKKKKAAAAEAAAAGSPTPSAAATPVQKPAAKPVQKPAPAPTSAPTPDVAAAKLQRFQRGVVKRTQAKEAVSAALTKAKDKVTTVKDAIEKTIEGDNTLKTEVSEDKDNAFITKNHLDNVAKYINLLNVVRSLATTEEPDANIISYLNSLADINLIDGDGNFTSAPISKDFLSSDVTDGEGKTVVSELPEGVLTTKLYDELPDVLDTTKFGKVEKKYVKNITEAYNFARARALGGAEGKDRVKDVFDIMLYTDAVISVLNKNKEVQEAINGVAKQSAVRGKKGGERKRKTRSRKTRSRSRRR